MRRIMVAVGTLLLATSVVVAQQEVAQLDSSLAGVA